MIIFRVCSGYIKNPTMISSQVNRFLLKNIWSRNFNNLSHNENVPTKILYPLRNRTLVKVSGPEAPEFLQGLITNDMRHFEEGALSIYALFLNNKGKILYDTIIHKWGGEHTFMVECDKSVQHLLQKHLKIYKLRRDITIGCVNNLYKIWAMITKGVMDEVCETDMKHNINVYKDPRLADLGYRLITTNDVGRFDLHYAVGKDTVINNDEEEYQEMRYRLGVCEGAEDLFPGTAFPLEANCDYLHGISFHKGCYIGQELTARIHHTGIVRKRLMPIKILNLKKPEELERDATIWVDVNPGKTNIGKFKNYANHYGLGLVRIKEALEAKSLFIGANPIAITKPDWWPVEAPKEKYTILKPEYESTFIHEK